MTPGPFYSLVARHLGIDEGRVALVHRALREVGKCSKAGRGPSSVHIREIEVGLVIVAIARNAAGQSISEAAEQVTSEDAESVLSATVNNAYIYANGGADLKTVCSISSRAIGRVRSAVVRDEKTPAPVAPVSDGWSRRRHKAFVAALDEARQT